MILQIIVTICFLALAVIDQCSGSLGGRVQFVTTNCTGLVMAVIILSGYKFKDFLKPLYLVWAVLCVIGTPIAIILGMKYYPYKGQWISGVVNVCIYGFVVLRAVTSLIEKRKAGERNIRWLFFVPWLSMIVLMMASPNESLWPLWFGAMFGSFYITDFDKDKLSKIYNGAVDGVIAGFFLIQGIALFFRPYDTPRYFGMYLNPNINSLLYVCAYCAFLCRWFLLRKNGAKLIFRILSGAFAAAMFGFALLTGCKSAFLAMGAATIVFLICILTTEKKKVLSFFKYAAFIGIVAVISVPITYAAVRYMPTIHLHPIYFEGEYNEEKVQPGEPRDSEKYVSFEEMLTENLGRMTWFLKPADALLEKIVPASEVSAAEAEETKVGTEVDVVRVAVVDGTEEVDDEPQYLYNGEGLPGPFKMRFMIHKYYFGKLNFLGHSNNDDGVQFTEFYYAPHAHNFLIQMAFSFGIPAGLLVIFMIASHAMHFFSSVKNKRTEIACIAGTFAVAFVVFGMFEYDWRVGQLPFFMFFFFYYTVVNRYAYGNEKKLLKQRSS